MLAIKLLSSTFIGALVSVALFWMLWHAIDQTADVSQVAEAVRINFSRMRKDTKVETKRDEEVERKPPPPTPETPRVSVSAEGVQNNVARISPTVDVNSALSHLALSAGSDRDVLPLVRIAPDYPPRALSRGVEGWVQVQFTITPTGTVKDAKVVGAEPPGVFDDAALKAIARWRYNPRVDGGVAVERVGVQTVIRFELEKDAKN